MKKNKSNVLIIGYGKRVKTTILPALYCLREHFLIEAVYSRTTKYLSLKKCGMEMKTCRHFDDIDFAKINIIFIAVTTSAVPSILMKLSEHQTKHLTLFIDTPVFTSPRQWGATKYFERYAHVYATEDCYTLPTIQLCKEIIESGQIGKTRHIYMIHSGFSYHAIASIKSLLGVNYCLKITKRQWNHEFSELVVTFPKGVKLTLLEPRDYLVGRTMIIGDRGCIVDYPLKSETKKTNIIRLGYELRNGIYFGVSVNGKLREQNKLDKLLVNNVPPDIDDNSIMNMLKIRGLMDMLYNLEDNTKIFKYNANEAIYDNIALNITHKIGRFYDLPLWGNLNSIITQIIRILSFILPAK